MNEQRNKAEPTADEIYKLVKENNRMLHAMRRDAFVGGILKFVFWILMFFVLPYILYVMYLQPYLETIQETYAKFNEQATTVGNTAQEIQDLKSKFPDFGSFFKQFMGGK